MVGNTKMMNHYTIIPYKLDFVGLKLITPTQIDLVLTTHTRTLPHVQYFPQDTLEVKQGWKQIDRTLSLQIVSV